MDFTNPICHLCLGLRERQQMYKIIGADQKEYGPISADQIRQWIAEGRANAQTMVQGEGQADWRPLSSYPELATYLPASTTSAGFGRPAASMGTQPGVAAAGGPPPPNYLVQSILVTLCCCLPVGIAAIVFAAQVNSKHAAGDIAGAQEASRKAKMFCWIALVAGIITNTIVVILQMMAAGAAKLQQ